MTSFINKHDCKFSQRALFAGVAVLFSAANVFAAIITQPTSLSPGDTYRLAFLTSTTHDALSPDIGVYNTFVDLLGDTVITSDWRVIGSTSSISARDNTGTNPSDDPNGVPIFLLNDTKLADTNTDLWDGTIDVALDRTEIDTALTTLVWTGTSSDGSGESGKELGLGFGMNAAAGHSLSTDNNWVFTVLIQSQDSAQFYALSGVLQVIPEPGTFTLLLTALGAVGVMYRSCKQKAAHHC